MRSMILTVLTAHAPGKRAQVLVLICAAVLAAVLGAALGAAPARADTSSTLAPSTSLSPNTTQAAQAGQLAVIPPSAVQAALNPGWKTDQMDVRVMPEYDQPAVLVIMGFTLPDSVALPATLKFPVPAGATIAGIGEIDPNGNFTYNYKDSYPPTEKGSQWDIASIEVKKYRRLQIDYYYDPGLPQGAGQRSFQVLAQMPMDSAQMLLHIQQPAQATSFKVQPALQGTGKADDGFTYSVAAYSDVKAGSTLGHVDSYNKADAALSVGSTQQSGGARFNTNTALLAAILAIVVIVGALVVYRLFFGSRRGASDDGSRGARRRQEQAAVARDRRRAAGRPAENGLKATAPAKTGATAKTGAPPRTVPPRAARRAAAATPGGDPIETAIARAEATSAYAGDAETPVGYCTSCGEELTAESPFCPSCGEARS
jgi:hypothetical protein